MPGHMRGFNFSKCQTFPNWSYQLSPNRLWVPMASHLTKMTLGMVSFSHSGKCVAVSCCGFNLYLLIANEIRSFSIHLLLIQIPYFMKYMIKSPIFPLGLLMFSYILKSSPSLLIYMCKYLLPSSFSLVIALLNKSSNVVWFIHIFLQSLLHVIFQKFFPAR